jgi:hypothetical protein
MGSLVLYILVFVFQTTITLATRGYRFEIAGNIAFNWLFLGFMCIAICQWFGLETLLGSAYIWVTYLVIGYCGVFLAANRL